MKRNISISTCFNYEVPFEEQISFIAKAGFSHISLGENEQHSKYKSPAARKRIKDLLEEHSLKIDTIHGPQLDKSNIMETILPICEAANDLTVPVVVLHGGPFEFEQHELEERLTILLATCAKLEDVSKQYDVTFALENVMPGPATELVKQAVILTNSKHIGFCYDSSHDRLGGPKPFALVEEMKSHLLAVHISDKVKDFVDHLIPGEGFIDWVTLCAKLRETTFRAPLLFEVMVRNSQIRDTNTFLNLTYERGCKLHDMLLG